jgi:hypothetical protein
MYVLPNIFRRYKTLGSQQCFGDAAKNFELAVSYLRNYESLTEGSPMSSKASALLKMAKQNGVVAKLLGSSLLLNVMN